MLARERRIERNFHLPTVEWLTLLLLLALAASTDDLVELLADALPYEADELTSGSVA